MIHYRDGSKTGDGSSYQDPSYFPSRYPDGRCQSKKGNAVGIKRLTPIFAVSILLTFGCKASNTSVDDYIIEARKDLKNYALVKCLREIDPESALGKDLSYAQRAFSFMGGGRYSVVQDEETLEVKHDPYQTVSDYMKNEAKKSISHMKGGSSSQSMSCLQVFNSASFDNLVSQQDAYIFK